MICAWWRLDAQGRSWHRESTGQSGQQDSLCKGPEAHGCRAPAGVIGVWWAGCAVQEVGLAGTLLLEGTRVGLLRPEREAWLLLPH